MAWGAVLGVSILAFVWNLITIFIDARADADYQKIVSNLELSASIYNLFDKDFLEYAQYAPNAYAALYNNMLEGRRLWVTANLSF